MSTYAILLRGINVGGKNKISMALLKEGLETLGFSNVVTYIASGNVVLQSAKGANEVRTMVEDFLPRTFKLGDEAVKALVLTQAQLQKVIDSKPRGFGERPEEYYSDVIFLMDAIDSSEALSVFSPREGVDKVWPGPGVVYSQRLGALRTKSRLSRIVGTPLYKSMTIRTWNTTAKLLDIMKAAEAL